MSTIKDLIKSMNTKAGYDNFAEEVTILSEAKSGDNYSLYTVKNKNNVTFQNVPGAGGITDNGVLGFIGGDRGRPTLLGSGTKVDNTASNVSGAGWPPVDISEPYQWDIQLYIVGDYGNDTETKSAYIKAL